MSEFPTITADANDWDWMEIVTFDNAVESEGFEYAFDHYGPLFRRPELRAIENDMGKLRDFWRAHVEAVEAWGESIGWDAYGELYEAHLDKHHEESARRRAESGGVS